MSKKQIYILIASVLGACLLLTGTVLLVRGQYILPKAAAEVHMDSEAQLQLRSLPEGWELTWPAMEHADGYRVTVSGAELDTALPSILLKDAADRVEISIRALRHYTSFGKPQTRISEEALTASPELAVPGISNFSGLVDAETKRLTVTFQLDGTDCIVEHIAPDGTVSEYAALTAGRLVVTFGKDIPIPAPEEQTVLRFRARRLQGNCLLTTSVIHDMPVRRMDLYGSSFRGGTAQVKYNNYALTWDETRGSSFLVQKQDSNGAWATLSTIPWDGERRFETGSLPAYTEHTYRVISVDPGGETVSATEPMAIHTAETPIGALIWPVKNLPAYADPELTEETGLTATLGTPYRVLDDSETAFRIAIEGQEGYIASDYVMINTAEYLGIACDYDITNSYSSKYLIHEYGIKNVSGTVITGYERVYDNGSFLVPVLYPVAKNLKQAAEAALAGGYKLKIYDAYRPKDATVAIYGAAKKILGNAIPYKTYTGVKVTLPEKKKEYDAEGNLIDSGPLTYEDVMLANTSYKLNNFLANGTSKHNYGIALDLTLVDLATGEELAMQTSMHDLSAYSIHSRDNNNAKLLKTIMTDAGFATITSEWWHYQIDLVKTLGLSPVTFPATRD